MIFKVIFFLLSIIFLQACYHHKIDKSLLQVKTQKNFYKDIVPIINKKCMNCHSNNRTLINFTDYESIYGRRAMVRYTIKNDLMPIWSVDKSIGEWKNTLSLTDKEKQIFLRWLDSGLPYKNKFIKLTNSHYRDSHIKMPDYILKLKEPVEIPATGFIPQYKASFQINFKEDKWIKEIELVLKPKVIHHLIVVHKRPDASRGEFILAWAVGSSTYKNFGKDIGLKISKDSSIHIEIHYEPIGKKIIDTETKIKLKFHASVPKYVHYYKLEFDENINIPPYHSNYLIENKYKIKRDLLLINFLPHMHLRGKKAQLFIIDPNGTSKEIFRLNSYNYNFQRTYTLKKPFLIKKNSTLICKGWFDNSEENPVNPDPSKVVKFGKDSLDEMLSCYYGFLIPNK